MKKIIIIFCVFLAAVSAGFYFFAKTAPNREPKIFGITFSKSFSEKFGIDWKKNYLTLFDDLGIRNVRIPVYWPEIEPEKGKWDFGDIDWQLEEAEKRGVRVILAVGRKLPRWPECHIPYWIQSYEVEPRKILTRFDLEELKEYVEKVVRRYDKNPAVWAWQVENEPFLPFGDCPLLDEDILDEEIALVRGLSGKPIIITDGGEFGTWLPAAKRADIFGSTLYRYGYKKPLGHFTYPLPPWFFRLKQGLVKLFYGDKPIIVVELQAEPWLPKMLYETSIEEQYKHFNPERFKKELKYIKSTGFDTFYFWGAEWWYWLKQNGHPEMWDMAKEVIKQYNQ